MFNVDLLLLILSIIPIVLCANAEQCQLTSSQTVDYTCNAVDGSQIDCDSKMSSGATVVSKCKDGYQSNDLNKLTCNDGTFDHPTPKCSPDCGVVTYFKDDTSMTDAEKYLNGKFPWHVGVYRSKQNNKEPQFSCGGSLVANNVVIGAAHCFYDILLEKLNSPENYKVKAGSIYRIWDHPNDVDNPYAQQSEVLKIYIHDSYGGDEQNQQSDLALLHLASPVTFSNFVKPVCVNLENRKFNRKQVEPNKIGMFAGWGALRRGEPLSDKLKMVSIPIVDYIECRNEAKKYNFLRYISSDKVCGGYLNGTSFLCIGDAGGGLVFPHIYSADGTVKWHLQGIGSVGVIDQDGNSCQNTYTIFTLIYHYDDFIKEILKTIPDAVPIK